MKRHLFNFETGGASVFILLMFIIKASCNPDGNLQQQ